MNIRRTAATAEQELWTNPTHTGSGVAPEEQLATDGVQEFIDGRRVLDVAATELETVMAVGGLKGSRKPHIRRSAHRDHEQEEQDVHAVRSSRSTETGYAGDDLMKLYLRDISRHPLLTAEQEVDLSKQIEAGLYAETLLLRMRGKAGQMKPADIRMDKRAIKRLNHQEKDSDLTGETLIKEFETIAGQGVTAKKTMIESNLRLVVAVAKRYKVDGMELLDLISEGNIGLVRAVEKFDYAKGFKFSTYATWWIRQAISRSMSEKSRTIRLPVHRVEFINRINRVERDLTAHLNHEPTVEQIAAALGEDVARVEDAKKDARRPISFYQTFTGGNPGSVRDADPQFGDLIEDTNAAQELEDGVMFSVLRDSMGVVLDELDERDAMIIRLRYGFEGGEPQTLDQIAKVFGVTRERIRQIEQRLLGKLAVVPTVKALRDFQS